MFNAHYMHHQRLTIGWVIAFALAQGLVRLAMVPVWWHYDELSHYEYLRYIVIHHQLPVEGHPDPAILASTATLTGSRICALDEPKETRSSCLMPGSQFNEQPGYYLLQSVFQLLFQPSSIQSQVWLARLVSVGLSLVVALLAYDLTRQVFPNDGLLALAVPTLLSTLSGYVDLMSALNNDVAAITAYSFLLWAIARLFRNGFGWRAVGWVVLGCVACLLSKTTAWVGLLVAVIALGLGGWPSIPKWARVVGLVVSVLVLSLVFDLDAPAHWQRLKASNAPGRIVTTAPSGSFAFRLEATSQNGGGLWQLLDQSESPLQGQWVTVGAWMRSPTGTIQAKPPLVGDGELNADAPQVMVTEQWQYYGYVTQVPAGVVAAAVYLRNLDDKSLEYDDVVVAKGIYEITIPPQLSTDESQGTWGNEPFKNLVANASAETGWLLLRPQLNRLFPWGGINYRLLSYYDLPRNWPSYWNALRWQFVTFWTGFGNGAEGLPPIGLIPFALVTVVATAGLGRLLVTQVRSPTWSSWQTRSLLSLLLAVGAMLAVSVLRIDPVNARGEIFYQPTARHFYNAIIPTVLFLAIGWLAWWPARQRRFGLISLVLMFYGLGVWSLFNVQLPYFHGGG